MNTLTGQAVSDPVGIKRWPGKPAKGKPGPPGREPALLSDRYPLGGYGPGKCRFAITVGQALQQGVHPARRRADQKLAPLTRQLLLPRLRVCLARGNTQPRRSGSPASTVR